MRYTIVFHISCVLLFSLWRNMIKWKQQENLVEGRVQHAPASRRWDEGQESQSGENSAFCPMRHCLFMELGRDRHDRPPS